MKRAGSVHVIPALYRATKDGELREDLSGLVTAGAVTYDQDREIKFSFEATVRDPQIVAPYRDFLAPSLTLRYADGYELTEPLGLYVVVPPKWSASPQSRQARLDGRDLTWLLASDVVDAPYTVTAGTNRIAAVQALLSAAGLTRTSLSPTSLTFDADRTWPPGTSKLAIINDILEGTGYYRLFARRDGVLASMPWQRLSSAQPAVRYATPAEGRVRVVRTVEVEPDLSRIANKVIVMRDDPAKDGIVATVVNTNPASPVSTISLGVTLTRVVRDQNLATQAEAEALALRLLEEAASVYTRLRLTTTPDPSRNPHEVYELDLTDASGRLVAEGKWWCTGWKLDLGSGGLMTHELAKLVPFVGVS